MIFSFFLMVTFVGCDYLSNSDGLSNVRIDLDGSSRAIGTPDFTFTSYTVTVTGPDIEKIQKTVAAGARYVNLYIPAGRDRVIRLDANLFKDPDYPPYDRDHVLSFAGENKVDLFPGTVMKLKFRMEAGECKLLVQSPMDDGRFMQISNMAPAYNEYTTTYTSVYDYDMDASGRLFFANGGTNINYRNDISSSGGEFSAGVASAVIAVDTINERIYTFGVSTEHRFFFVVYDPDAGTFSAPSSYIAPANMQYTMRAIDYSEGYIYAVGLNDIKGQFSLYRYQPGSLTAIEIKNTHMNNPWDILVKGGYIYITNFPKDYNNDANPDLSANPACIEVFERDTLAYIGAYGTRLPYVVPSEEQPVVPRNNQAGRFYGPHHFIATSNQKIYVIDDGAGTDHGQNRIIAFDSVFDWSGWEILRTEDIDPGKSPLNEYFYN